MDDLIKQSSLRLYDAYSSYSDSELLIGGVVNILNMNDFTSAYSLKEKLFWSQVNDQKKVLPRLDRKFAIWKNTLLKNITESLEKKKLPKEMIEQKRGELTEEIEKAREKLLEIQRDPKMYDVRISKYHTGPSLGVEIRFRTKTQNKEKKIRLKNSLPNVLYFMKKKVEVAPHNELATYFESAEVVFGDVYAKRLTKQESIERIKKREAKEPQAKEKKRRIMNKYLVVLFDIQDIANKKKVDSFTVEAHSKSDAMDKAHTVSANKYPKLKRLVEIREI